MRCGFRNLFTKARPNARLIADYLDALDRQSGKVREALPGACFARFAIGGGTPTYLDAGGLATLIKIAERTMGADLRRIGGSVEAIDPLFPVNNRRHPSLGRACRTGRSVVSVDGDGTMRRCHFVRDPIGNLYEEGFESTLIERPCPNATCSCHIGYVHLDDLGLRSTFGPGILERIPVGPIVRRVLEVD